MDQSTDKPRLAIVENDDKDPMQNIDDWLPASRFSIDVYRPHRGDVIPRVDAFDGLIVLGGSMGAGDDMDAPWLPQVRELMVDCVSQSTPLLGVCLGAQLLAMATGGEVQTAARGPEIGVIAVDLTPEAKLDPIAGALATPFTAYSLHYDFVSELPPYTVRLGENDAFANQIFRVGSSAWGVQFHPEVTPERFRTWVEFNAARNPGVCEPDAIATHMRSASAELVRDGRSLIRAFGNFVVADHAHQLS